MSGRQSKADDPSSAERAALLVCPPIAALADADRAAVLEALDLGRAEPGQRILRQGDAGDAFFVLLSGRVEVYREQADGSELLLVELEPGAYFGEQALRGLDGGRRSASVRALTPLRFAAVPARVFRDRIEATPSNREAFEQDAASQLYTRLQRSLEAFGGGALDESRKGLSRQRVEAGETVIAQGEASDAAFLVLEGVAIALSMRGDDHRELSRLGPGQLFGELGVLEGNSRAATVKAETDLSLLRIEAVAFKAWHAAHPRTAGLVDSLSEVYALAEGRKLSVFMGQVAGEEAVTTLLGDPTSGVVSTRIVDRGAIVFVHAAAAGLAGEREQVVHRQGDAERTLRIIVTERSPRGIERARVEGLSAEGIGSDLGTLYRSVVDMAEVTGLELRRFKATGFLGGEAEHSDRLCPCLGIGVAELELAAAEVGRDLESLKTNFGLAALCGGCEPALRAHLAADPVERDVGGRAGPQDTHSSAADGAVESEFSSDAGWLAKILRPWADASGRLSREAVSMHLRGLGSRDPASFVDQLFGSALAPGSSPELEQLTAAIGAEGLGYAGVRGRQAESRGAEDRVWPVLRAIRRRADVLRPMAALLLLLIAALVLRAALAAGPLAVLLLGLATAASLALLAGSPSLRFIAGLLAGGMPRFFVALDRAYGQVLEFGRLRAAGPKGPPVFVLRDERMIDRVLQNPEIYARNTLAGYPPFGAHSLLGAGSGGEWLGYRSLCEEYFVEGYRSDLGQLEAIARERVTTWPAQGEIDLLDEIYRIVVEVRARLFFQTSFGCFDAAAQPDMAGLIDRVLSLPVLVFGDESSGEVQILHERVLAAVRGATRPESVGGILREAMQDGRIREPEALENATMYVLAQAPVMGIFWTLYRATRSGRLAALREDRIALLQALKEELRLHPSVNLLVTRIAQRDDQLGDLAVPKGAVMMISPFFVHGNPAQWQEPRAFQPEHWSVPGGDGRDLVEPQTDPEDSARRPCPLSEGSSAQRYLPFGAGPQACQGRWFAADEMLTILRVVLESVELEVLDDGGLLDRPLPEQVLLHVYNRPARDVRMLVRKR